MNFVSVSGKLLPAGEKCLSLSNSGYRYGDSLFETIKVWKGKIQLAPQHFERLFKGMGVLQYQLAENFTVENLEKQIIELCRKNQCEASAKVRLTVSRDQEYTIEADPLEEDYSKMNARGLLIDIYTKARKSCDAFSNLKTGNFLLYTMAALHAREKGIDDCIIMNAKDGIADSSIANIFIVKHGTVITPSLGEGCIAGVMRKLLLEKLPQWGYEVSQRAIHPDELKDSDEVFLTNAIRGIRWVAQYREKHYSNEFGLKIFTSLAKTIYG